MSLPTYSGVSYILWGRSSCPQKSKLIYNGQIAGKHHSSFGGGTNYLCLPNNPEYDRKASDGLHTALRATHYRTFNAKSNFHRATCAACETDKRVNHIMIPAKTSCPTSEWTLEYKGFIMSMAEYNTGGVDDFLDNYHATSYICVDSNPESLTSKPYDHNYGSLLYTTHVACSGTSGLHNCPPYKPTTALSCVVCSK